MSEYNPELRCFQCMKPLEEPGQCCPHCGYDNSERRNGVGELPEKLLQSQYLIGKTLGRGGFGITYIGYDFILDQRVAIKEYFPTYMAMRDADGCTISPLSDYEADFTKGRNDALKEARTVVRMMNSGLPIPNVVKVYNAILANGTELH